MNLLQMLVVSFIVAAVIFVYVNSLGIALSYWQALGGVYTLKALALFLTPEKAPMVFVRGNQQEEENE